MFNSKKVALCIDKECATNPEIIGLSGENLFMQPWLDLCTEGAAVREKLYRDNTIKEIWVYSNAGIEAINLAAALKKDNVTKPVILIAETETGSLKSRAKAAFLDMVLSREQFIQRYGAYKSKATQNNSQQTQEQERESFLGREKKLSSTVTSAKNTCGVNAQNKNETENQNQTKHLDKLTAQSHLFSTQSFDSVALKTSKKSAFVLPIVSASGGSGKSSTAVVAAYIAQKRGYSTLLIDADLQFGDLSFLTGTTKAVTLNEVVENPSLLSKTKEKSSAPVLIAAPHKLEESEIAVPQLMHFIDYCSAYFDLIVINTGSFWLEQHITLLERASVALFLLDQRPSAMRDCKHALEFCSRCAIATQPFRFVLNRCSRNALFSSIDIACGLHGASVIELHEGGKEVGELLGAGQPLDLISTKNSFCLSVEQMLDDVLPRKGGAESMEPRKEKHREGKRFSILRKRGIACL